MKIANAHAGSNTWTLRTFTFLVWVAVGACAAYWAFKFVTTKPIEATAAIAAPAAVVDTKAVAKLLGATDNIAAKAINAPSTIKLALFGLATTASGDGVALIATEDKPAKPYRVGAQVTDDLVLKSISKVDAILAASTTAPESQKLSLPDRKPATFVAASTLPPVAPLAPMLAPSGIIPPAAAIASPVISEALRPTSRFAPRAAGVPPGAPPGAPAMPVQAPANPTNPAMPTSSTINPAAAASSGATAISGTADSVVR